MLTERLVDRKEKGHKDKEEKLKTCSARAFFRLLV
jgi:hypothetical protein